MITASKDFVSRKKTTLTSEEKEIIDEIQRYSDFVSRKETTSTREQSAQQESLRVTETENAHLSQAQTAERERELQENSRSVAILLSQSMMPAISQHAENSEIDQGQAVKHAVLLFKPAPPPETHTDRLQRIEQKIDAVLAVQLAAPSFT